MTLRPLSVRNLRLPTTFYRAGKFAEAEASYEALLKPEGKLQPAQWEAAEVGRARAMLRQQKIDEALDAVNAALTPQPNSAALLATKGDVQLRRGEMYEAEGSYLAAKKLDPKEVHAYLGLARLYGSYSLYRKAYDQLQGAHEVAADNIEVQKAWLRVLPRKRGWRHWKPTSAVPIPMMRKKQSG